MKPKIAGSFGPTTILCNCCGEKFNNGSPHNCIANQILAILNREAPLGAAGYMTPKHKVELAKAIYSELFDWKSALLDKVPTMDDGEHLFILRIGETGETRVLYGHYSDLRADIEKSVGDDKIVAYMVIK